MVAKNAVDVALVVVAKVAKVEEAMRESGLPINQRPVEVALTPWPAYVLGVNGKAAPAESVPQEKTPEVSALTSQLAAFKPETIRAVEEAIPETERLVVVAAPPVRVVKVVRPVFDTEKRVEVAVPPVVEAIIKRLSGLPRPLVEVATTERSENGVELPMPIKPATSLPSALVLELPVLLETPIVPADKRKREASGLSPTDTVLAEPNPYLPAEPTSISLLLSTILVFPSEAIDRAPPFIILLPEKALATRPEVKDPSALMENILLETVDVVEEMLKATVVRGDFVLSLCSIERYVNGDEVPIPTLPAFVTTNVVALEEPMAKAGAAPLAEVGLIESCAHGVEEPRPRKPVEESN